MFVLVKYSSIILFFVGLYGFAIYTHLCDFYDKFFTYIEITLSYNEEEYDYIVVGAGSAGSVIASRLSQDPSITVLVLEAGGFGGKLLDIPAISPLLHKTLYDWQYEIEPQKHACGAFKNNGSPWPMGKIIGGSGRLNNMMYTRGDPQDFHRWYKDHDGYDYKSDILKYFKRAENQIGIYKNDSKFHSSNGPLTVNDLLYTSEIYEPVINSAINMGLPVRDINGEYSTGFSRPQVNVLNGARYSTGHYLLDRRHRGNLIVRTFAHVEKILFKSDYEAYAVRYDIFNRKYVTRAKKGVILSAGAIGSPKILMLSGIGDKNHLEEKKIRPIKNLPVGENLQDHIATGFDLVLLDRPLSTNFYSLSSPMNHLRYLFASEGPLTSIGCEICAFLNSNCLNDTRQCKHGDRADLEFIFLPIGISSDHGIALKDTVGLKDEVWARYFSKLTDKFVLNILPIVLHPKSVGKVRLRDKDPSSKPVIDPNYLAESADVESLIDGIEFVRKLISQPEMQKLGAKLNDMKFPGCEDFSFGSRDYFRCYVRRMSFTLYHPVGTCKMGSREDAATVVDYDFKVIGTNRLFVVDASVMPSLISANINAAVVMLAEKAVDVLKMYRRLETGVCFLRERLDEVFLKRCFIL